MDYYENAIDTHESAEILYINKKYRMSVYHSCLAVELYLKSKLPLVEYDVRLEASHDTVNIYRCLVKRFPSSKDFSPIMSRCRKYFNESRYPSAGIEVYSDEFAKAFLNDVDSVRNYIDNECIATLDDLKNKFGKIE